MKNSWLRVAYPNLEMCSKMENYMVTEVCRSMSGGLFSIDPDATLFASAIVSASRLFLSHRMRRNFMFDSRNSMILLPCAA
jgi:hypothetical protein